MNGLGWKWCEAKQRGEWRKEYFNNESMVIDIVRPYGLVYHAIRYTNRDENDINVFFNTMEEAIAYLELTS